MTILNILTVIPLAPLFAACFVGLFGKKLPKYYSFGVPILGVSIAFALSMYSLYLTLYGFKLNETVYTWLASGGYIFEVGFLIDTLSAVMMVIVTFISLMVHIYTISYMKDDTGFSRFFSYISLFTFAMLMLVMSNNFLQLFFGWEAVGLVSYLLIGFWYKKPRAIYANLKAFLVNRVGDFGLILGVALIMFWFGTLDYQEVFNRLPALLSQEVVLFNTSISLVTLIGTCLFIGAMGKSAQVPLHVWLPDSMEGPTPISALIHAATMVTAGIYLVARMSPLFELSDFVLSLVIVIGAITAISMGILGIVQNDIKKIIAYSTLSQLGYMTVALGVSAYSVAIFHLLTHAFFKALLFLGAGSVIIGMHHDQDITQMGGLKKYMPVTALTFLIGSLSLIGTPLFSGFYSKETIIEAASLSSAWGANFAYFALVFGVFFTALYSFRLYFLVFCGEERWHTIRRKKNEHGLKRKEYPVESSKIITIPLVILAIPSIFIGMLLIDPLVYGNFFDGNITVDNKIHTNIDLLASHYHGVWSMAVHSLFTLPLWFAIAGVLLAWALFIKKMKINFKFLNPFKNSLKNNYGFDDFNEKYIAKGILKLGDFLSSKVDIKIIDDFLVNGSGRLVTYFANKLKLIQSGYIYHYAFFMIIGLFLLISFFVRT